MRTFAPQFDSFILPRKTHFLPYSEFVNLAVRSNSVRNRGQSDAPSAEYIYYKSIYSRGAAHRNLYFTLLGGQAHTNKIGTQMDGSTFLLVSLSPSTRACGKKAKPPKPQEAEYKNSLLWMDV